MNQLFLSSFFSQVAQLLPTFLNSSYSGEHITFIPTAANPEKVRFFVDSDRKALEKLGFIIDEIDIALSESGEIREALESNKYLFVSGGNTFYLLQELKRTGTDKLIINFVKNGKVYIGSSAGSIVLAKNIEYVRKMDNPKKAPQLSNYDSLGVIEFYPLPHYNNSPFKKVDENIIEEYSNRIDLKPISNNQVIIVNGNESVIKSK